MEKTMEIEKAADIEHGECEAAEAALKMEKKADKEYFVRKAILLFCLVLSGALSLFTLIFAGRLLFSHAFYPENLQTDLLEVDRVYEQYTRAEVSGLTEEGDVFKELVWLDIPEIQEGNFIWYYHDQNKSAQISFDYYSKTLLMPFLAGIVFLIFFLGFFLLWKSGGDHK